jgi:hypothetical protein
MELFGCKTAAVFNIWENFGRMMVMFNAHPRLPDLQNVNNKH